MPEQFSTKIGKYLDNYKNRGKTNLRVLTKDGQKQNFGSKWIPMQLRFNMFVNRTASVLLRRVRQLRLSSKNNNNNTKTEN